MHAFLDGAEKLHTSATVDGEETAAATPVVSLDYFFLGLTDSTGEGTTPTLVLCDGNTTYSLEFDGSKERSCSICSPRCLCFSARVGVHANDPQE